MNAGDLTDIVTYRTRSTGGFIFSKEWVRNTLLSLCHNTVNSFLKRVFTSATWTMTPEKAVYDVGYEFTNCDQIISMRNGDRLLSHAKDFSEFFKLDMYWFRSPGFASILWSQIGDFLAVYPQPKRSKTLDVVYLKDLQAFETDESVVELPDEDLPFCIDLAEIILLVAQARGGKLVEAQTKLQAFSERYGLELSGLQDRSEPKVGE